ncbi:TetR family transcriptional regulator [Nocardiopsis sediminis]|uniref:TetR family transcriptional regulator n=1 Tax=Nocardiopsis sediminis TaxID=1778267 RepID=A0ABV8FFK3_9ACTN
MARTGRRPGATRTRDQILSAAREQFAELGFGGATIRGIARAAEVDPALVHHFFGSKEDVFVAAMRLPYNPATVIREILAQAGPDPAPSVLRGLLRIWDAPETQATMVGLIRSAVADDRTARVIRDFLSDMVVQQVSAELGVPPLRATAAASQLLGLIVLRYVLRIEPVASAGHEDIVREYSPALGALIGAAAPPTT